MLNAEGEGASPDDIPTSSAPVEKPSKESGNATRKPREMAPASARQALEDARQLVRARRQGARDRHPRGVKSSPDAASAAAEAVASLGRMTDGKDIDTMKMSKPTISSTPQGTSAGMMPGFGQNRPSSMTSRSSARQQGALDAPDILAGFPPVAINRGGEVSYAPRRGRQKQQQMNQQHQHQQQSSRHHQRQPRGHTTARGSNPGVKRSRVLPDFTANGEMRTVSTNTMTNGSEKTAEDAVLVSAVRAVLAITEAQLENANEKTTSGAGSHGKGNLASSPGEVDSGGVGLLGAPLKSIEKPQVRQQVVIRTSVVSPQFDEHENENSYMRCVT